MKRERPVIVAVDLGERSRIGLAQARAVARRDGCALILAHVQAPTLLAAPLFPQRHAEHALDGVTLRARAVEAMAQLVEEVSDPAGPGVRVELLEGEVTEELVQLARRRRARLLVVAGEPSRVGATTAELIRRAPCPVLVARPGTQAGPVVAATDLSDEAMPALRAAAAAADHDGAPLCAVHVVEPWLPSVVTSEHAAVVIPFAIDHQIAHAAKHLAHQLERIGATSTIHTPAGVPAVEVARYADEVGARLVVIGTIGRSGMWRFLLGSVAEDIVRRTSCSVLVTRLDRRRTAAGGRPSEPTTAGS